MKIGLFYGSSTCYTEIVAEKIRDFIGDDLVTLHNVKDGPVEAMQQYDLLIMGIPTWDFGELQEDWEAIWPLLPDLQLRGKPVALYGMGDQIGYSEWFLDALGMLHDLLKPMGVQFIGQWPTEGFEFISLKAVLPAGDQFVGLALDDVNQFEMTDDRVERWCEQILTEVEELL